MAKDAFLIYQIHRALLLSTTSYDDKFFLSALSANIVVHGYQVSSCAVQISAIFFDETTGFYSFNCFLPKLIKSVSQEWSSGIL